MGRKPNIFKSGIHSPQFYEQMWATLLSGEVWRGELCNRRRDGQLYWESAVIAPVRGPDGSIINYVALKQDVTRRKQMERELVESEEKFKHIFETMREGFVEVRLDLEITLANPAAARILGYESPAELVGQSYGELFIDPEERKRLRETLASPLPVVAHIRRQDGAIRVLEGNLSRRSPDQQLAYCIFRDVTDRLVAQEESRARQAAEEANRLKGEFLANMSHEVRTPLHAIMGMTHLVSSTKLSLQQRDYIEHVQRAGKALLRIVNDILDFSKIEAGKLELDKGPFRFDEVIENITRAFSDFAAKKGLALLLRVQPEGPLQLVGDRMRLEQVLINLVSNAIKFTDAGSITVEVGSEPPNSGHVLLRFCVRDTGIGMSSKDVEGLFQVFSQVDASLTRRAGGTGLGLAICRKLVHLMDGEISVESCPGQGSAFIFQARFEVTDEGAQRTCATLSGLQALVLGEAGSPSQNLRGRVLVVEDNQVNLRIARELLESKGLRVDGAGDGAQAVRMLLEALPECPWDLILMDLQMPEMDGFSATRALREEPRLRNLPIVAMTAHALAEEGGCCLAAGMNDYVTKPIDPELLFSKVARWLPLSSTPAAVVDFPTIAEVDTIRGLARVAGNADLYRSLLLGFADAHQATSAALEASVDPVFTGQLAHRLKGEAGNLGLTATFQLAAELEAQPQSRETCAPWWRRWRAPAIGYTVGVLSPPTLGPAEGGEADELECLTRNFAFVGGSAKKTEGGRAS